MIKVENIKVYNIARAIYSARNALNSWDKSDSDLENDIVGKADLDLARRLYKAKQPNRKYLRQIFVSMDITAPTYWLAELDTYRVGMTRNSCSFMHKGLSKPFEISDFSLHSENGGSMALEEKKLFEIIIDTLNDFREMYLETKDERIFQQIRCMLPSGYNQRSTYTMNYENVVNIIEYRTGHKLDEWNEFVDILWGLPYLKEIAGEDE
jgi:hypothetical protein